MVRKALTEITANSAESEMADSNFTVGGKDNMSIERRFQKKTQLEHILLRPDTYIGSVEPVTQTMWVYDGEEVGLVNRQITFVPGLYKIFDEILVNAADNKQHAPSMDTIKVDIDPESNTISIYNNGDGIPVQEHKVEKMFVPSLIFGHLLTSSNYNDEEKKVTGGRNGYGAKLCNIFSTMFSVETSHKESNKHFKQVWKNNMQDTNDPNIRSAKGPDFTCVKFSPDLSKFKMSSLDKDIVALMSRRAFDVAGSTRGVKVFLNGKRIPIKGFKDYVDWYVKDRKDEDGNQIKIAYECVNPRWEVAVTVSDKGLQQVSFVNSIATTKGGRHVDHVLDQITDKILEVVKKKTKKEAVTIKPFQIKNHVWIFVNCLIENPTFDSQTKENMTLQMKSFGSKCQLTEKFITSVQRSGIVDSVMQWVHFKAQTQLNKKCNARTLSKLKGIPKLEDANHAGTKRGIDCTLILTEGDSAKTTAVSGLGVVGRDQFGVFPLRGKLLNVREATSKQILDNAEINNIIKIMGLQYKKKYETAQDLQSLRYGRLMIMTDQDQDGSHIKGLLINFIHHNWPSLLRVPFLEEFITPIVKVKRKGAESKSFYSLPEFEEWKRGTPDWNKWTTKYYKGLGTSDRNEAREYFADMDRHRILFNYTGVEDDNSIQLAFSKKMIEQRKEWLTNGMEERKRRKELGLPELYLYEKGTKKVSYQDFVNKELILFSNMDNERSIPSAVDGFKPGQRKVMFTCLKRKDKKEVKVAVLAGDVSKRSAYHHGEASLHGTIINLAQNFVGSNNINLLLPIGQFGSRLQGGKDAASPRYIFTNLSPLGRHIFNPLDEPLLKFLQDDNQKIEPEWYIPIIPMVLVNGAEGIGTGWMTKIPNYNPREIVQNIFRLLRGEEIQPMIPWFKNFKGTVTQIDNQRFVVNGEVAVLDEKTLEITELPIRTWTQSYKEGVLEPLLHGSEKSPAAIIDYKEYNTDTTVRFVVTMLEDRLLRAENEGLHKVFKLQSSLTTTSMVLFDHNGCLRKYEDVGEILTEFFELRLQYYGKRHNYLQGKLEAEALKLSNQARFILEKISGELVLENKKRQAILSDLVARKYDPDPVKKWHKSFTQDSLDEEASTESDKEEESSDEEAASIKNAKDIDSPSDYDYLMHLHMWHLSREKKEKLLAERDRKKEELEILKKKTPSDLWQEDLDAFLAELDRVEEKEKMDDELRVKPKPKKGMPMKGRTRERPVGKNEVMPSPHGRRIEPRIDPETRKKAEKAANAAGDAQKRGRKKKDEAADSESEGEVKPLAERLMAKMNAKDGKKALKQTTLTFKKAGERKRKKQMTSDSEDEASSLGDSDSDRSFASVNGRNKRKKDPPEDAAAKQALFDSLLGGSKSDDAAAVPPISSPLEASNNGVYDVSSDGDLSDFNMPAVPKKAQNKKASTKPSQAVARKKVQKKQPTADSDDDTPPKPKKSKKVITISSTDDDSPVKTKKKRGPTRKPKIIDDSCSDSDTQYVPSESPKKKKTKADEEFPAFSEDDFGRVKSARTRAPVKYNFGDDESNDSDF